MLNDLHVKVTDALMQTQEFQQVADSLERWVSSKLSSLKSLELPAVRAKLIEPQIEGFKVSPPYIIYTFYHSLSLSQPILEDIKLNTTTLEQAKQIGTVVATEASIEEKLKIEKRLHALELRFFSLDKQGKARMSELQVII